MDVKTYGTSGCAERLQSSSNRGNRESPSSDYSEREGGSSAPFNKSSGWENSYLVPVDDDDPGAVIFDSCGESDSLPKGKVGLLQDQGLYTRGVSEVWRGGGVGSLYSSS